MEENNKELNHDQMEKVSGGVITPGMCKHLSAVCLGDKDEEGAVVWYHMRCRDCGYIFWSNVIPQAGGATGSW